MKMLIIHSHMRSFREFVTLSEQAPIKGDVDEFGNPTQAPYFSIFEPPITPGRIIGRKTAMAQYSVRPRMNVLNKIDTIAAGIKEAITNRGGGAPVKEYPNATLSSQTIISGISEGEISSAGVTTRSKKLNILERKFLRGEGIIISPGRMGRGTIDINTQAIEVLREKLNIEAGTTRKQQMLQDIGTRADRAVGQFGRNVWQAAKQTDLKPL